MGKRGRSRSTWPREVEAEMSKAEHKWRELEAQAKNCVQWKGVLMAYTPPGSEKSNKVTRLRRTQ